MRLQAGPTRPGRATATSGQRSLPLRCVSAPGGWRATKGWPDHRECSGRVRGEGAAHRAEPPSLSSRCASGSVRPLRESIVG
jgi:hypothetical protein